MYDFMALSSVDLELLVRDLLQKSLGIRLEAFRVGKDGGIDLRYAPADDKHTIVQCKHYAHTGFKGLISHIVRNERPKIEALAPKRYILATSVSLNPREKNSLLEVLTPFCNTPGDIIGAEDLNGQLRDFPEVERAHFKLWLSSTAVLNRLLRSRIYTESKIIFDRIRLKFPRYVQNESFPRAYNILNEYGYCIIAGIPGIGKTMLAEMLLLDLVGRGFDAFVIRQHVSEAFEVLDPDQQQVFYYDDFLGLTGLDNKLGKNEDKCLKELGEYVMKNSHAKLILTTREYILKRALRCYEGLANSKFTEAKYVVEMESYTRRDRARILYNHLFFSSVPRQSLAWLMDERRILKIVDHNNYSPRIIEYMTESYEAINLDARAYFERFYDVLSNPITLWKHAFGQHISATARAVLLVMTTFDNTVSIDNLRTAVESYSDLLGERLVGADGTDLFLVSLDELEGTFLNYDRTRTTLFAKFHNPSIKDFLESVVYSSADLARNLCRSACFYDQLLSLGKGDDAKSKHAALLEIVGGDHDELVDIMIDCVPHKAKFGRLSVDQNVAHAMTIVSQFPPDLRVGVAEKLVEIERDRAQEQWVDPGCISRVIDVASGFDGPIAGLRELLHDVSVQLEVGIVDIDSVEELECFFRFDAAHEGVLSGRAIKMYVEVLRTRAGEIFDEEAACDTIDEYVLEELRGIAEEIAEHYGLSPDEVFPSYAQVLEQMRDPAFGDHDRWDEEVYHGLPSANDLEILDMFEGLLAE
jgi:hypothetical protein